MLSDTFAFFRCPCPRWRLRGGGLRRRILSAIGPIAEAEDDEEDDDVDDFDVLDEEED